MEDRCNEQISPAGPLAGKVALVTGAGRGIGRAVARRLSGDGALVLVNYNGSRERALEVVEEIRSAGGQGEALGCDVSDYEACGRLVEDVIARYGHVDILVNNAGITRDNLILRMSEEEYDRVLDVNLKGAFNTIRHLSRFFLKQRSGKIINVSSVSGIMGNPGQANYAASKAGLIGLTKSVARELAGKGICARLRGDGNDAGSDRQSEGCPEADDSHEQNGKGGECGGSGGLFGRKRVRLHYRPGDLRGRRHVHVRAKGDSMRRVVVTGMGAVTPIGIGVEAFWEGLKQGRTGFAPITRFDASEYKCSLAAEVRDFDPEKYMDKKTARRMEQFCQFAVAAAGEAIADAGLNLEQEDSWRVGCSIGSGIGSLQAMEREYDRLTQKGPSRVSPLFVPLMISNMAAGNVSIFYGLKGKNLNVVTACATGTNSIGEAFRAIQYGDADVMAAGGAEGCVTPLGIAGFCALTI